MSKIALYHLSQIISEIRAIEPASLRDPFSLMFEKIRFETIPQIYSPFGLSFVK